MYVIGGRLFVHCTEGNCSLEVPLLKVYWLSVIDFYRFLQGCDKALLNELVLKLRPLLFVPGDVVCRKV